MACRRAARSSACWGPGSGHLGQYLRPTQNHLPVKRYVTPAEFDAYRAAALSLGFVECVSGPLVRSSYRAEQALARNNAGVVNQRSG